MNDRFNNSSPKSGLPLAVLMPLALIVFVAAATWWSFHLGRKQASESVRSEAIRDLTWTASRLEAVFERALRLGDHAAIQEDVAALATNRDFTFAVLTDETHQVLHSMRVADIGKQLDQVLPAAYQDAPVLTQQSLRVLRQRKGGKVEASADGRTLIAAYPLVLGIRNGELRPNRIGNLVIVSDYSLAKSAAFQVAARQALSFFTLASLLAAGLGLFFHFGVARRLNQLARATERFGSGSKRVQTGVGGSDEVGDLARSIDHMMIQKTAADQERDESEERLRAILESATDSVITIDERGIIESANPATEKLFGYTQTELLGTNVKLLIPSLNADDHDQLLANDSRLGETKIVGVGREAVGRRKDGSKFPIDLAVSELTVSELTVGGRRLFTGVVRDASDRRRAEELQTSVGRILEDSLNEIYIVDAATFKFIQVNRGARENLGYTMDELRELTPLDLNSTFTAESLAAVLEPLSSGQERRLVFDAYHRRKNGTVYDVELHAQMTAYQSKPAMVVIGLDITERKQAENQLRLGHQAIESAAAAICFSTLDGNVTFVNQTFLDMWGYDRQDEILGRPIIDFSSSSDDAGKVLSGLREHGGWIGERLAKRKDGSFFEMQLSASMVTDQEHEPIAMMASMVDISDRKRAEESLLESEERYRGLFESTHDLVQSVSPHGDFVLVNPAWKQTLGYNDAELKQMNVFDIVHPDSVDHCRALFQKVLSGEMEPSVEVTFVAKDGRAIIVEGDASPGLADGEVVAVYGFFRDITDRKKAEEWLRIQKRALESAVNGILITDPNQPDNPIIYVNDAAQKITGYSAEEIVGRNCRFLQRDDREQDALKLLRTAISEERKCKVVLHNYRKDGTPFWNELTVSPVRDENGKLTHFVGIQSDITEREEAAEKLAHINEVLEDRVRQRTEQLEIAQEQLVHKEKLATLGQLAGGVAHEIRNPMGVIRNGVYYLKHVLTDEDEETTDALNEVSRGLANSERIVSELLDYARGPNTEASLFPLHEAITAALEMVPMPDCVRVQRVDSLDARIHADRGQIERLLANLIQNAAQAMPGGGTLTLRCTAVDSNVVTEVSDTGVGIADDELEQVFEPLFTKRAKGIGLGLAVCRRYAELSGGTIVAESALGRGSTFRVTLPLANNNGSSRCRIQ